jgi:hypothetical protein
MADHIGARIGDAIDRSEGTPRIASADLCRVPSGSRQKDIGTRDRGGEPARDRRGCEAPLGQRPDLSPRAFFAAHSDGIDRAVMLAAECASCHAAVLRLARERSDHREARSGLLVAQQQGAADAAAEVQLRAAEERFAVTDARYEELNRRSGGSGTWSTT